MTKHSSTLAALALALLSVSTASAQLGHAPEEEASSFSVAPGFEVSLFASETNGVIKPIQMRWDERGRLWVIGSKTYPQLKPGEEPDDQVIVLEDTDHDGKADKTTVFADHLLIPTGLEVAPGRAHACYVGEGSKLWLLTDTDGDGRADKREVVLRGFGTGDNHQNINSFRWSPAGELLFCQGLHAHARVETAWGVIALDQAGLWRYRPREQRLDGFFGGPADPQNPWGWIFTKWAQPIVVAGNSGNMYYPLPEMIRGYQGGRRESIWLNGRGRKTSNPEIVESAHFPPEWQGVFLAGGYINNGVWTLAVEQDGAGLKITDHATLPPLLQSKHGSFRPVDVRLGPDGAIYICDWYNPIIGHYQASFRHPDRDKAHGRIWRVTAKGRPLLTPPDLSKAEVTDLFEIMRSPDRWPREQAKRVLFGLETKPTTDALRTWYQRLDPAGADYEFALMQALGVYEAHEVVEIPLLKLLLNAKHPEARAYAASTVARWADRLPLEMEAIDQLATLAADQDPRVRLATIVAAGNIPRGESMMVLWAASKAPRDPFIKIALTAAVSVLKPLYAPKIAEKLAQEDPTWPARLKEFDKPKAAAPVAKPVVQKAGAPIVPIYGRLRASPYVTGSMAKEVLAHGDPQRGREVYRRPEIACIVCHRVGNEGGQVGPALDALGSAQPLEFIIGTVIEPQREIKEGFETVKVTTKKGGVVVGVVVAGNASELTLRDAGGQEHTVAQAEVATREFIGSLMPAGLTDNLSPEDLRDLFAYLSQLGKVK